MQQHLQKILEDNAVYIKPTIIQVAMTAVAGITASQVLQFLSILYTLLLILFLIRREVLIPWKKRRKARKENEDGRRGSLESTWW